MTPFSHLLPKEDPLGLLNKARCLFNEPNLSLESRPANDRSSNEHVRIDGLGKLARLLKEELSVPCGTTVERGDGEVEETADEALEVGFQVMSGIKRRRTGLLQRCATEARQAVQRPAASSQPPGPNRPPYAHPQGLPMLLSSSGEHRKGSQGP